MKVNQEIINLLQTLVKYHPQSGRSLVINPEGMSLENGGETSLSITKERLLFLGKHDFSGNFEVSKAGGNDFGKIKEYRNFLADFFASIVRLNHLGIGYFCQDFNQEKLRLESFLRDSAFEITEKDSGMEDSKWLFVKARKGEKHPSLEIVLKKGFPGDCDEWFPHFQMDLELNLEFDEMRQAAEKYFGRGFFGWEIKTKSGKSVIGLGTIANMNGFKIRLDLESAV